MSKYGEPFPKHWIGHDGRRVEVLAIGDSHVMYKHPDIGEIPVQCTHEQSFRKWCAPSKDCREFVVDSAAFMAEVRELLNYCSQGASNGYTLDNELGVTRCDNCDEIYEPTLGHVNRDCACCAHNSKLSAMLARLEPFEIGAPDNKPQWSATPPTEPGFYWTRDKYGDCEIVELHGNDYGLYLYRFNNYQIERPSALDVQWWPVRIEEPR